MSKGWVAIHRKLLDSWVWTKDKEFTKGQAWVDILLSVNHAEQKVLIGNEFYSVGPGESVRSIKTWAARWGWSRGKVRRFLDVLENDHMIEFKTDTKTTHLSVCNWETYQQGQTSNEHQIDIEQTSNEHQTDTNNNDNNVNKESVALSEDDFPAACTHLDEAKAVARFLLKAITSWDPSHKYNKTPPSRSAMNGWILEFERAMRLDGRNKDQLVYMIKYIFGKNTEVANFWKGNIQSGEALRNKFELIKNQIKKETGKIDVASPIDPDDLSPEDLKKRGYMGKGAADKYSRRYFREPLDQTRASFKIYRLNGKEYFKPAGDQ